MKLVRKILYIIVLCILMFGVVTVANAATGINWLVEDETAYDTSFPGTILLYSDPLSQGGMNLSDALMTSKSNADIVFSSDGNEIGARGIIDLGEENFDAVTDVPDYGYVNIVDCIPGHVYIVSTHNGGYAKVLIEQNLGSSVNFRYALGEAEQVGPEGTKAIYDASIPGTILLISNPISQGGLNFSTGEMTTNANETDIAMSGSDIGSRAIIDLGSVDMDSVVTEPDSGYQKMVALYVGHVYITQTHDGKFIKFYVKAVLSSSAELIFQEITHEIISIEVKGDISNITKPVQFNIKGKRDDGKYVNIASDLATWTTSDDSIAFVDSKGLVTFTGKAGTVYITAEYEGIEDSYGVLVTVLTSIKIDQKLQYNSKPVQLTVTGTYSDGKKKRANTGIVWSSNNKSVATIDSKGVVRFTGKMGKVTITAKVGSKTSSVTCTVGNVLVSVKPSKKLAYSKKPIQLKVIAKYANGKTYTLSKGVVWKSSNTSVARVNSKGVVTFTGKNGSVIITGTYKGLTASFVTNVFLRENELKFYAGKTWRLYMNYVQLDVGTLKLLSNGTYKWTKPSGQIINGKWVFNKKNTITLYNFGYNQNLTYEMGRWGDGSQVGIFYNNGETGSDYYIGK